MYLLDTVVISALRRPERHPQVSRWLQAQQPDAMYISAITVGEIRYGAERQRRMQPAFAELLERWLEYLRTWFQDRILPFDEGAANRWGALHRGMTVVTRNVRDFTPTGATVLNPFDEQDRGPMTVRRPATGGRRWTAGKVDPRPFQTAEDSGKIGST